MVCMEENEGVIMVKNYYNHVLSDGGKVRGEKGRLLVFFFISLNI